MCLVEIDFQIHTGHGVLRHRGLFLKGYMQEYVSSSCVNPCNYHSHINSSRAAVGGFSKVG